MHGIGGTYSLYAVTARVMQPRARRGIFCVISGARGSLRINRHEYHLLLWSTLSPLTPSMPLTKTTIACIIICTTGTLRINTAQTFETDGGSYTPRPSHQDFQNHYSSTKFEKLRGSYVLCHLGVDERTKNQQTSTSISQ